MAMDWMNRLDDRMNIPLSPKNSAMFSIFFIVQNFKPIYINPTILVGLSVNYNAHRSEPQYLLLTPHFPVFSPLLISKIPYRPHYREIPCFLGVSGTFIIKAFIVHFLIFLSIFERVSKFTGICPIYNLPLYLYDIL